MHSSDVVWTHSVIWNSFDMPEAEWDVEFIGGGGGGVNMPSHILRVVDGRFGVFTKVKCNKMC